MAVFSSLISLMPAHGVQATKKVEEPVDGDAHASGFHALLMALASAIASDTAEPVSTDYSEAAGMAITSMSDSLVEEKPPDNVVVPHTASTAASDVTQASTPSADSAPEEKHPIQITWETFRTLQAGGIPAESRASVTQRLKDVPAVAGGTVEKPMSLMLSEQMIVENAELKHDAVFLAPTGNGMEVANPVSAPMTVQELPDEGLTPTTHGLLSAKAAYSSEPALTTVQRDMSLRVSPDVPVAVSRDAASTACIKGDETDALPQATPLADGVAAHAPPIARDESLMHAIEASSAGEPLSNEEDPVGLLVAQRVEYTPGKIPADEVSSLDAKQSDAVAAVAKNVSTVVESDAVAPLSMSMTQDNVAARIHVPQPVESSLRSGPTVPMDVPDQTIVREVRAMVDTGVRTVTIRLNPPSLGMLRVEIVSSDGDLELRLSSATPATRALLESQGGLLRDALQEQGLRVSRIHFAEVFADNVDRGLGDPSEQPHRHDDGRSAWRPSAGNHSGDRLQTTESPSYEAAPVFRDGCLNVRV